MITAVKKSPRERLSNAIAEAPDPLDLTDLDALVTHEPATEGQVKAHNDRITDRLARIQEDRKNRYPAGDPRATTDWDEKVREVRASGKVYEPSTRHAWLKRLVGNEARLAQYMSDTESRYTDLAELQHKGRLNDVTGSEFDDLSARRTAVSRLLARVGQAHGELDRLAPGNLVTVRDECRSAAAAVRALPSCGQLKADIDRLAATLGEMSRTLTEAFQSMSWDELCKLSQRCA